MAINKIAPTSIQVSSGKKIRYKTLSEDYIKLNRFFFEYLTSFKIPVLFEGIADENSLLFTEHAPYPFFARVVNHLDSASALIFEKNVWEPYPLPVFEYGLIDMNGASISKDQIISVGLSSVEDLKFISRLCTKINAILKSFFERRNTSVISFTCIFGKTDDKIAITGDFFPPMLQIINNPDMTETGIDYFQLDDAAQLKKHVEFLLNTIQQ